jgi:hypothetical protein
MKTNIIHFRFIVINQYIDLNLKINEKTKESFYLCNLAVRPNKKKMIRNIKKVTCKNCLRIIKGWNKK